MTKSFTTRSLGIVTFGISRKGIYAYAGQLGGGFIWKHDGEGWKKFKLPPATPDAKRQVRLPLVLAVWAKFIRLYTPRALHWAVLDVDVDCDGTSWHAHRVRALTLAGAEHHAGDGTFDVMSDRSFRRSEWWGKMDEWDRGYWRSNSYANMGMELASYARHWSRY